LSKYVELESHVGTHLLTKKDVVHEQYLVYIKDDKTKVRERIGLIGWKPNSKLVFMAKLDPAIRSWVEEEVAELLNKESLESSGPPQISLEQLSSIEGEEDELNEKDLT
jgi:hypothetical protein